jgi:hypothetical protein
MSVPKKATEKAGKFELVIDQSKSTTEVQIRLPTGKTQTVTVNLGTST